MSTTVTSLEAADWVVTYLAIDRRKVIDRARILLDSAHSDFGLITYSELYSASDAILDNDNRPIYFEAFRVRAACFQQDCYKKLSILTPLWQIDLEFPNGSYGRHFMHTLKRHAWALGNVHFEIVDVPR